MRNTNKRYREKIERERRIKKRVVEGERRCRESRVRERDGRREDKGERGGVERSARGKRRE